MTGAIDNTTFQNLVTALNGAFQTYLTVQGIKGAPAITTATLVKSGAGRLATVVVIDAGSAVGAIYDANAASSTTGQIYAIPETVGVFVVNVPVSTGIVVAPGSGQKVTISYS